MLAKTAATHLDNTKWGKGERFFNLRWCQTFTWNLEKSYGVGLGSVSPSSAHSA